MIYWTPVLTNSLDAGFSSIIHCALVFRFTTLSPGLVIADTGRYWWRPSTASGIGERTIAVEDDDFLVLPQILLVLNLVFIFVWGQERQDCFGWASVSTSSAVDQAVSVSDEFLLSDSETTFNFESSNPMSYRIARASRIAHSMSESIADLRQNSNSSCSFSSLGIGIRSSLE